MKASMATILGEVEVLCTDEVPRIEVGDGCYRRDLPSAASVRAWIVEMTPGSMWPHVDQHPDGEDVYVIEGEMVEGNMRFPAGSYLHFAPGSSHQPSTDIGVRLIGWNPKGAPPAEKPVDSDQPAASLNQHRVVFDFEIDFSNGGGLQGQGFRLDIEGDGIADEALADYIVRDMRLLMVGEVRIRNKRIIEEAHKRIA